MERLLEQLGENQLPNRAQAESIMERALKVLYYRDKSTYNNWSIGFAEQVSLKKYLKQFLNNIFQRTKPKSKSRAS